MANKVKDFLYKIEAELRRLSTPNYAEKISVNQRSYQRVSASMSKGFTLIETLISVAIIGISFVGVLFSLNQFAKLDRTINEKSVAIYLAQEGVEIVRNIRDTNVLRDEDWDRGITNGTFIPILESGEWELETVGGGNQWKVQIYYNPNDNLFLQSKFQNPPGLPATWQKTTFYREIEINKNNPDGDSNTEDFRVKAKVWYGEQLEESAVIVEGFLYNWRLGT